MYALHARYRGREVRRAELVQHAADALSTLDGVDKFHLLGVEDICTTIDSARATTDVTMALLSAGEWSVGIGVLPNRRETNNRTSDEQRARTIATASLGKTARSGAVKVRIDARGSNAPNYSTDISAVFCMLAHILGKRTFEGREATALMRSGFNQNEAAEELGISKQAMSQRLQAAGWHAEAAGWQLAMNLLARAECL